MSFVICQFCLFSIFLLSEIRWIPSSKPKDINKISDHEKFVLNPQGDGINFLPPSFYSNAKDSGKIEIGDDACGTQDQSLPYFTLEREHSYNFLLLITFNQNPLRFESSSYPLDLGLTFHLINENNEEVIHEDTRKVKALSEMFVFTGADECSEYLRKSGEIFTSQFIIPKINTIAVSFLFPNNYQLKSIEYCYASLPYMIQNITLTDYKENYETLIENKYQGNDIWISNNVLDPFTHEKIKLNSQYGMRYSFDYLKKRFPLKDSRTGEHFYFDSYEDVDGYFIHGNSSTLNTIYTIKAYRRGEEKTRYVFFEFEIVDYIGPNIIFKENKEITESYRFIKNEKEFIDKYFIVADNYDAEISCSLSLRNHKKIPYNQIGRFECIIEAQDQKGNKSNEEFILNLYDDIKPKIYIATKEINISKDLKLSKDYLLSLFTARDEIDGVLEVNLIEDTYSENQENNGSYHITGEAIDSSGNVSNEEIQINVVDENDPSYGMKEHALYLIENNIPALEEIVYTLIRQGVIEDKEYIEWKIIQGENLDGNLSLGIHQITVQLQDKNGDVQYVKLLVEVVKKEESQRKSIWQKISDFFINLWNKFISLFQSD